MSRLYYMLVYLEINIVILKPFKFLKSCPSFKT